MTKVEKLSEFDVKTVAIIDLANGDKKLAKYIDKRLHQPLKGTKYTGYAFFDPRGDVFDPRGDIIPSIIRDFNEIQIFKLKMITIFLGLLTFIFFGYLGTVILNMFNRPVILADFKRLTLMCAFGMILCVLTLISLSIYEQHFKTKLKKA